MAVKGKNGYRYGKATGDVAADMQKAQAEASLRRIARDRYRQVRARDENYNFITFLDRCADDVKASTNF
jgi:hypothetical protein